MLVAANPRQQRNIHLFSQRTSKKHNNRTEELPPVGFEVLALVLKLEGGSGGPARSTFRKSDHQEILAKMLYLKKILARTLNQLNILARKTYQQEIWLRFFKIMTTQDCGFPGWGSLEQWFHPDVGQHPFRTKHICLLLFCIVKKWNDECIARKSSK